MTDLVEKMPAVGVWLGRQKRRNVVLLSRGGLQATFIRPRGVLGPFPVHSTRLRIFLRCFQGRRKHAQLRGQIQGDFHFRMKVAQAPMMDRPKQHKLTHRFGEGDRAARASHPRFCGRL